MKWQSKIWHKSTYLRNKNRLTDTENRPGVTKGRHGGGRMDWEFGVSRCQLLSIGWINKKVLLYSTRNYIQYPANEEHKKQYLCMYNWFTLKLTQYVIQLYFSKISYKQKSSPLLMWWRSSPMIHTQALILSGVPIQSGGEGLLPFPVETGSLSTMSWTAQPSHPQEPLWLTHKLPHMPGLESMSPTDTTITRPWQNCHDHWNSWWQTLPSPSSFSESSMVFVWFHIQYKNLLALKLAYTEFTH